MINILVEPKVVLSMPRAWARLDKRWQITGRGCGWVSSADGHRVHRGAAGQTLEK